MRGGANMVFVLTTTLVHLAVLGSGAWLAKWRVEEQITEESGPPDGTFERRGTKVKQAIGKIARGAKSFQQRRRERQARKGALQGGGARDKDYQDYMAGEGKQYSKDINRNAAEVVERRRLTRGEDAPVNVLILMSDTGGGHRASAQALEAAFEDMYPGRLNLSMVDIWTEHSRWPYNQCVPGYQFAAKNPLVWRAVYEYSRFPPTRLFTEKALAFQNFQRFTDAIRQYSPDFVISVHPMCQDLPLKVLRTLGENRRRELPFVTVVTDLGSAHPTWFDSEVDKVFIASDAVMRIALRKGIDVGKVHLMGLPTRPAFWKESRPREELREELGLEQGAGAVLVVGGGDGVGGMGAIARAIIETLSQEVGYSQVIVVCGKNRVVSQELETATWPENVHVIIKGFVTNMDEWMGAVDCIVTKAGPGTIAEATIRGLPIMLSGFLPGQEEGNVPFVIDGGFGDFSKRPSKIGATVAKWLKDPELLERMRQNALRAARPHATYDIAREIADMMFPEGAGAAEAYYQAAAAADAGAGGRNATGAAAAAVAAGGGEANAVMATA